MTTAADLRTKFRDQYAKIDRTGKVWGNSVVNGFLNRAKDQIEKDTSYSLPINETSTTFTITGATTYTLPTDYVKNVLVSIWQNPLGKTDKQTITMRWLTTWIPNQYYLYGWSIGFDTTGWTSVSMLYKRRTLTISDSQDCELDDICDDALCAFATYLAFKSVGKVNEANQALWDYELAVSPVITSLYDDEWLTFHQQNRWYKSPLAL